MLSRDNETVRDKFFRVLWIATLIWKLSSTPVEEQEGLLETLLAEAKITKPDGTQKTPQKRKASSASSASESKTPKKRKGSQKSKETLDTVKIKMIFPEKKDKKGKKK